MMLPFFEPASQYDREMQWQIFQPQLKTFHGLKYDADLLFPL